VSPRQITRVAVARSLKRLCTPGVDFHPSHKNNVENEYIYLRPYRKYNCHSADLPETSIPVTTLLYEYIRESRENPSCCYPTQPYDVAFQFMCCARMYKLKLASTGKAKYASPTALPVSYQNLKNERMESGIFGGQFLSEFLHCTTLLSNPTTYRYRLGGIIGTLLYPLRRISSESVTKFRP